MGANPCAVSPDYEIDRYRQKLEAGAEFAITQPVFDPDALFRFLDAAEAAAGRAIPVMAGVWPLTSLKNAEFMRNEVPGVTVPDAVVERMRGCRTKEDGVKQSVEIAREICARIAPRVAASRSAPPSAASRSPWTCWASKRTPPAKCRPRLRAPSPATRRVTGGAMSGLYKVRTRRSRMKVLRRLTGERCCAIRSQGLFANSR